MNLLSWLLLAALAAWLAGAIVYIGRHRGGCSCGGGSARGGCSGCAHHGNCASCGAHPCASGRKRRRTPAKWNR